VPAGLALPSVLAYRTVAVWLPSPAAIAAIPGLRTTIAGWAREDATSVVYEHIRRTAVLEPLDERQRP
jgi:hypothetical protein